MSKELEMLRNVTCDGNQMVLVASPHLRRILARLEAAERVCESLSNADWGRNIADQSGIGDSYDAYRALDTKEPT